MSVAAHSFGLPEILVHYFFLVTVYLRRGQLGTLPAANNTNKLGTPISYEWNSCCSHNLRLRSVNLLDTPCMAMSLMRTGSLHQQHAESTMPCKAHLTQQTLHASLRMCSTSSLILILALNSAYASGLYNISPDVYCRLLRAMTLGCKLSEALLKVVSALPANVKVGLISTLPDKRLTQVECVESHVYTSAVMPTSGIVMSY